MQLSELMVDTKSAWIEYPGLEGLEFELATLSRPELTTLRKRCITTKFDKNTRKAVEELNEERFISEFAKATIKNWKGFKMKYIEEFMVADTSKVDPDSLLDYSQDNARILIANSTEFDNWVNDTVFDLANFRSKSTGSNVGKTGKVAE